jgi:5-methylcytosine-specific restriction protein B
MSLTLNDDDLRAEFARFKAQYSDDSGRTWRERYAAQVALVRDADADKWMTPIFQKSLWEGGGVSGIGPGSAVSVTGAYADTELAAFLLALRDSGLPSEPAAAAIALQAAYDDLLARVRPKHTEKRPRARIVRLLAALFPHHMTCLMDERRTLQVQALIGAAKAPTGFVGQNPPIRARLREAVNDADATDIDYAMFSWFLWESRFGAPEPDAIETVGVGREPAELPALSLLPATAQRNSLTFVRDNIRLLVAVLREAQQGLSRPDLIQAIRREAPYLSEGSASIIISQAMGGLGLIKLSDGGYRPTDRGAELLTAAEPSHLLRAPLIGRVLGIGHLLRILQRHPQGRPQQALASDLQALFSTWTTARAGQELIQWLLATELARAEAATGGVKVMLTEDGEDYAAALPADFDERWRVPVEDASPKLGDEKLGLSPEAAVALDHTPYAAADIVADGCFLPLAEIEGMLALLRHKKNLVLQGPPGTGKTWLARRIGYALATAKDPDRVMAVQFQPSLSYEDFVRGWRPYAGEDGQGGLRLADGAFLECINAALARPDEDFVLVIEEINRGNPAQILGELLTLLEADKRVESEALRLAYPRTPGERVFVPPNLHVVGTMNLANRSLALVDLALRRRFAFKTLSPTLNDAWRAWCISAGAPAPLIDTIQQRIGDLNATIAQDNRLRAQFCVGHSFVTPPKDGVEDWAGWFRAVVETEIGPLLDEYWYDDEAAARAQKAKLLLPL